MAIKDWKKIGETTWIKNNEKELGLYSSTTINGTKKQIRIYDWNKEELIAKNFKTKQEALAYAKSYMKKH